MPPAVDSGAAAAAPSSSDDNAATASESPPTPALGVPLATGTAVATSLVCRGVEFGFQYLNFFGEWELATEPTDQLYNGRPHYIHSTMYGDCAHLFHCIDLLYHVPRWVIGPSPSGQNGWAFCESDAPTPHQIIDSWMSWDGFSWSRSLSMRFVPYSEAVAAELLEEESELERRFVREDGLASTIDDVAEEATPLSSPTLAGGGADSAGASAAADGAAAADSPVGGRRSGGRGAAASSMPDSSTGSPRSSHGPQPHLLRSGPAKSSACTLL